MSQVTLYLDDTTQRQLTRAARGVQLSKSRWVNHAIQQQLATQWPEGIAALAGSWQDFPDAEQLRSITTQDLPREPF